MRDTIGLTFLCACVEGLGDYNFKKYALENKTENLIYGVISYGVLIRLLIQLWSRDKLSVSNAMWNSFSLLINGAIGISMGERLTLEEMLGGGLSLSGIGLIATQPSATF